MKRIVIFALLAAAPASLVADDLDTERARGLQPIGAEAILAAAPPAVAAAPRAAAADQEEMPPGTFYSSGRYANMDEALTGLLHAEYALHGTGAKLTGSKLWPRGDGSYAFSIGFLSAFRLSRHENAADFASPEEAGEGMLGMAALLADGDRTIILAEMIANGDGSFGYVITALEGVSPRPDDDRLPGKAVKACLFQALRGDSCVYRCAGGTRYEQPAAGPGALNGQAGSCPQLIFNF